LYNTSYKQVCVLLHLVIKANNTHFKYRTYRIIPTHKALKVKNVYFECFVISGDKRSAKAGMHYSKNNVNFIDDVYCIF